MTWMCESKSLGIAISSVLLLFFRLAMRSIGLILHDGARGRSAPRSVEYQKCPSSPNKEIWDGATGGGRSDTDIAEDPGGHVRNPASCISVFPSVGVRGSLSESMVKAHLPSLHIYSSSFPILHLNSKPFSSSRIQLQNHTIRIFFLRSLYVSHYSSQDAYNVRCLYHRPLPVSHSY